MVAYVSSCILILSDVPYSQPYKVEIDQIVTVKARKWCILLILTASFQQQIRRSPNSIPAKINCNADPPN